MKKVIGLLKQYWPFIVFVIIMMLLLPVFNRFQEPFHAWMMRLHQKSALNSPVRIVCFDGKDIESLGGWPLSRNVYGFLVRRLSKLGVKKIGFHVYWGSDTYRDENDVFLTSTLSAYHGVVGSFYFQQLGTYSKYEKTIPFLSWPDSSLAVSCQASGLQAPDSMFFVDQTKFGFVNLPLTAAGTVTEAPLFVQCGQAVYPSFNMLLAGGFTPNLRLPGSGQIKINYHVDRKHLPMISVRDIINSTDDFGLKEKLDDTIVIVGVVSSQLGFERPTPLDPAMPVIGIHAQVVENLLNGSFLKYLPISIALLPIVLLGSLIFLIPFTRLRWQFIGYGFYLVLVLGLTWICWQINVIFPIAACITGLIAALIVTGVKETLKHKRQFQEEHEKRLALESRFGEKVQSIVQLEREYLKLREKYQSEIDGLREALIEIPDTDKNEILNQYPEIICSPASPMVKILAEIERIGQTDESVFIYGESGTGKELIANAIHNHSPRAKAPFVAVNCGAIAESLLESELFGHEKGAFTGAHKTKSGFFESAGHGTIFLDEITETTPAFQARLLRVLQEGTYFRVGSSQPVQSKCRVIAASNQDVIEKINTGGFRQDLYFRLNVLPVTIPPLRERVMDIPLLLNQFLKGKAVSFSTGAKQMSERHRWPGNVRELQNLAARIRLLPDGSRILSDWLRTQLDISDEIRHESDPLDENILSLYREFKFSNDANTRIAENLGNVHRSTVTEYLKGMAFQFYYESGFEMEGAVRKFNKVPDDKLDDRIQRRIQTYLKNLTEKVDPSKSITENVIDLQDQLRKLPKKYHEAFQALVKHYIESGFKV